MRWLPGTNPLTALAARIERVSRRVPALRGIHVTGLGLVVAFGIVALLGFVQVSSTPSFCGTCHIMKPYYASWKHSKHNKVACVECHISPGITAEVRKKYEALSMVVKYVTATYGTKPWAEVDDAACLRCHARRLLEGKVEFNGTTFDHRPHLTESRRGLRLRCTSCHSQIVQGTHLTVTTSTCALCHFKDQPPNDKLGACLRCHQIPERVTAATGVAFDHAQVAKLGMECTSCHGGVVRGDGAVPKERCLGCHNQADRLEKYGDKLFLHTMHVTKHKVDCQGCHALIEHGKPTFSSPVTVAEAGVTTTAEAPAHAGTEPPNTCQTCHGLGHSAQEKLYTGTGGRGVPRMPSPMYLTGVTCQGCHNPAFSTRTAASQEGGPQQAPAGVVACMACHGPTYGRIFTAWTSGVRERTDALRRQMEATLPAMGVEAPQAWDDARSNFALVSKGLGVHNINYAYVLLDKAFDQMNDARRGRGMGALSRPWPYIPRESTCMSCHLGIENQSGAFGGRAFAHGPHLVVGKLDCQKCHRPHAERPSVEVVRFGPDGCTSCHHQNLKSASFSECARCHGDINNRTFVTFRGEFSHRQHAKIGEECQSCHQIQTGDPRPWKSNCTECHESRAAAPPRTPAVTPLADAHHAAGGANALFR